MPTQKKSQVISIPELKRGSVKLRIIGRTPLFQNRMSAKVKQGLLVGSRKKTKAERLDIKHDPYQEYRDSAEVIRDQHTPTALGIRVVAIKAAMCTAAIETAGLTKASTQRLIFMPGEHAPLYGTPQLKMDIVRSADINRTPDVRSRAFLPRWGAEVDIDFVQPQLNAVSIATLLTNAGMLIGLGDFRQEKGKGAYGSFRVISATDSDEEWDELVANHGRTAQEKALLDPIPADEETCELLEFFEEEVKRRAA